MTRYFFDCRDWKWNVSTGNNGTDPIWSASDNNLWFLVDSKVEETLMSHQIKVKRLLMEISLMELQALICFFILLLLTYTTNTRPCANCLPERLQREVGSSTAHRDFLVARKLWYNHFLINIWNVQDFSIKCRESSRNENCRWKTNSAGNCSSFAQQQLIIQVLCENRVSTAFFFADEKENSGKFRKMATCLIEFPQIEANSMAMWMKIIAWTQTQLPWRPPHSLVYPQAVYCRNSRTRFPFIFS